MSNSLSFFLSFFFGVPHASTLILSSLLSLLICTSLTSGQFYDVQLKQSRELCILKDKNSD